MWIYVYIYVHVLCWSSTSISSGLENRVLLLPPLFANVYKWNAGWDCELWGRSLDPLTSDRLRCNFAQQWVFTLFPIDTGSRFQTAFPVCGLGLGLWGQQSEGEHCVSTAGDEAFVSTVNDKSHDMRFENKKIIVKKNKKQVLFLTGHSLHRGADQADSGMLEVCSWENKALMSFGVQAESSWNAWPQRHLVDSSDSAIRQPRCGLIRGLPEFNQLVTTFWQSQHHQVQQLLNSGWHIKNSTCWWKRGHSQM